MPTGDGSSANILGILLIFVLVAANGFFVAAEFALVAVRRSRVAQLVAEGRARARALKRATDKLDAYLAATQLGITISSLALGWVGEPALAHLITPLLSAVPHPWGVAVTHTVAIVIAFILITFLHVVLGELAPKALALQRADVVALYVAGPLNVFGRTFRPFIKVMNGAGNLVVRSLKLPPIKSHELVHSVDELSMLVEETQEAGVIPADQATYVQRVFELSDKTVGEIMVPRERVVAVSIAASEEEVLGTARETAHTRLPVWEGSPDHIVGIVNTKDLFHLFSLRGLVILMDAVYPPLFVQTDMSLASMLRIFRRERRPMAIVRSHDTNRYVGIVTLEDVLEEIVGEIEDEHDVAQAQGRTERPKTAGPSATPPPASPTGPSR